MNPEQLEAIRKRSDKASGNWIADYLKMKNAQVVLGDDVPALLAEVERLREAAQFYANENNHDDYKRYCENCLNSPIDTDNGEMARNVLGGDA